MKKTFNIFLLAAALVVTQACGPKKEKTEEITSEVPAVKAADTKPTLEERRARIQKEKNERAEARRIAWEERYRVSPSYVDANGNMVFNKA